MKHYKLIWLVVVINAICFFIPHEYFKQLTVQSNETKLINVFIQSFAYMFMSENWMHLLFNMVFLFTMSKFLYVLIPNGLFIIYYVIWGFTIGFLHYLLAHNGHYTYLIGCSGVLYAFLSYLVFFVGNTKIEVLNSVEMSLFDFGLILVGICVIQIAIGSNVWGNIAHLNGIILGLITAVIYKKLKLWQHN